MRIRQEQTSGFADPDSPMRQHQLDHIDETLEKIMEDLPITQFAASLLLDEFMNFCGEPTPKQIAD
jgi:hypothetical protein